MTLRPIIAAWLLLAAPCCADISSNLVLHLPFDSSLADGVTFNEIEIAWIGVKY